MSDWEKRYREFWAAVRAASGLPWHEHRDDAIDDALKEFAPDALAALAAGEENER